ncbi:MAG TPA: hypothetical protein DEV64_09055 [Rhodospirillaceae bacterium]|nr:hypothetical protein [Rhodospirillaceae bacterium]|tara:strand:+ start:1684 stop:2253 length:570 start_codon:yes stop_codon:yes gene_type:complete
MPLSTVDVDREPIHTRAIECRSFRRSDGLWDIEGHLTDVKAYPFSNEFRGEIKPGEPLHDMWIRLTVDREFTVQQVEVHTDSGPYEMCPAILPNFQKLSGLKIGPGWNRRVRESLGGARGCAHLVDMLKPIATVAFHTVRFSDSSPANAAESKKLTKASRPPVNTCHVWSSDGEMIRSEYPDFYTGKAG